MRTKALIITAALGAVGLSTSVAPQVYSINAVGFVNVTVPKGYALVANPLVAADNKIPALFKGASDGTTIYKYDGKNFSINGYDALEDAWGIPAQTMDPGEGAFILSAAEQKFTFVGEVKQGHLVNNVPKGLSIRSSMVPQSANLDGDKGLGWPTADGDTIHFYRNGAYVSASYDELEGKWSTADGKGPVPGVGEAFFALKATAVDWVREFSVNTP